MIKKRLNIYLSFIKIPFSFHFFSSGHPTLYIQTMSQHRDQDFQAIDKQLSFPKKIKQLLFLRNYTLITSLKLTLSQALILIIIDQLQKISIITRFSVNPNLSNSPEMYYFDQLSRILLLDIFDINDHHNLIITVLLIFGRILIILVILIPLKGQVANEVVSKYILTFLEMVLTLPSIILSVNFAVLGVNVGPNIVLYLMTISTTLIYESMQLECSFDRQNNNLLVRTARPLTFKIINLVLVSSFPIINHFMYPTSFSFYSFMMLIVQLYNWTYYLYKFIYFHEIFMYAKGIMLTINISANVCYLIIYVLNNAIISQNILLFIITFSIFLGNFFITYRKYILKNTITNKELKGDNQIALYSIFYWHCFTKITQKKNQLYISSLLKKHTNQCNDPACCCKNRVDLYDTHLKIFGNPSIQPHFDKIFIRYYIRKIILQGYQKYNKSSLLAFLLSNYSIQIIEMVPQTMQLIKKLSKMQQKKQLNFTQQFLLFSLKMKAHNKIIGINLKRGNVNLQNVKEFDEQIIKLSDNLRTSVKVYHNLWKHLQNTKLNQAVLYDICKNNLELMFNIQTNYKNLKSINNESSQLRAIMLFYSRLILHDIHLLSEVKKDIKNGHERNMLLSTLDLNSIQLFGNNTATMVSLQNSRIKWSSKNAFQIFQYSKQEFHNVSVKNLMPKHFADRHDSYIQKWKTTGYYTKINKTTYLWGCNKHGECFSMLMFVKVIPLLHDQQYAFFSCMQKLDDQSQLICSSFGEVYGSGKLFSTVTNINPRYLQEIKMNIQVFIPYTFQYFLDSFYPNNPKLKSLKRSVETRREGYFPENLDYVMKELQQQRKIFIKKHEKVSNYDQQYLNFIRKQMQELTCHVNGQYISFSIVPFKLEEHERRSQHFVVLKVSNPKKDSLDKYYSELQKMINKLQTLSEEESNKEIKSIFRRNKSDFFKAFLNPKRLKRLLQKQKQQKGGQRQSLKKQASISSLKAPQTLFAHRKRLAMGAKFEIKNDRARYNIFKMKKILLEEGIISRYTYNILIGRNSTFLLSSQPNINLERTEQGTSKTLKEYQQDRNVSQEDKDSIDLGSEGEIAADKDNDNKTFNSGSSSATFISMTNHVKLFKLKLRSLNTPRLLLILNVIVFVSLISAIFALIYLTTKNISNLEIGINQFKNNYEANLIIDSLFLGQININNLNTSPNNTCYQLQRTYFINSISKLYATQMQLRAQYKQIDPNILSYLSLQVVDQQVLTVIQFIELILDQIITKNFNHVMHYFTESMSAIAKHSATNVFFVRIENYVFGIFLASLVCSLALFVVTLPIVYKLKIKIKEIYGLLSKISTNDKLKYFRHFSSLNEEFKKREQVQYTELNNLTATYQSRFRLIKTNTKPGFSEQSLKPEQKPQKTQTEGQQQSSISTDKVVYFKITAIYLVLLASVLFNYLFLLSYHNIFINVNDQFISLFNSKTLLTSRVAEGQFQMMGYLHEFPYNTTNIEFVDVLYSTYSISQVSQKYKAFVFHFVASTPCDMLTELPQKQRAYCWTVNNNTFAEGGIDNLYYTQRKIQEKVNEYYKARNYTPNDESALIYPQYFLTKQYVGLNSGYYFSTLMIYKLYGQIESQMRRFADKYVVHFNISLAVSLSIISVFIFLWVLVYLQLAQNASYINAFLLLIPFDVLSENPYIKLYIKNEFDYKTNY